MSAEIENRADIVSNETEKPPVKLEVKEEVPEEDEAVQEAEEQKKPVYLPTYTVKCGTLTGTLHHEHFICPGIHQNCIMVHGETELISPKMFTVRANKDKQKDWKGSIRIDSSNMRTMMETKKLDFYEHTTFCSAKCQSRNYLPPKEKNDFLLANRRTSLPNPQQNSSHIQIQRSSDGNLSFTEALASIFPNRKENQYLFKNAHFIDQLDNLSQKGKSPPITASPSSSAPTSTSIPTSSTSSSGFNMSSQLFETLVKKGKENGGKVSLKDIPTKQLLANPAIMNALMTKNPDEFWTVMCENGLGEPIVDIMVDSMNTFRSKIKAGSVQNVSPFLSRSAVSMGMQEDVASIAIDKRKTPVARSPPMPQLTPAPQLTSPRKPKIPAGYNVPYFGNPLPPLPRKRHVSQEDAMLKEETLPKMARPMNVTESLAFHEHFAKIKKIQEEKAAAAAAENQAKTSRVPPVLSQLSLPEQMAFFEQLKKKPSTENPNSQSNSNANGMTLANTLSFFQQLAANQSIANHNKKKERQVPDIAARETVLPNFSNHVSLLEQLTKNVSNGKPDEAAVAQLQQPDPEMPCLESAVDSSDVPSTSTSEELDFSTAFLMQSNPNQSYTEMLMHLG